MTKERLQYIFKEVTEKEPKIRQGLITPWIDGEFIYASDGHVLLCLRNEDERDKAFEDNWARHPNARKLLDIDNLEYKENYYIRLDELEKSEDAFMLDGVTVLSKAARQAAKVLRLFGLETSPFYSIRQNQLLFKIRGKDGLTGALLVMGCFVDENLKLDNVEYTSVERMDNLLGAYINDEKGEAYYKKCLEDERIAKEKREKDNFSVYEVTLVKYATICVRADDASAAKRIARDNAYDGDFDDAEVDSYTISYRDLAKEDYDCYYDENGEQEWEVMES